PPSMKVATYSCHAAQTCRSGALPTRVKKESANIATLARTSAGVHSTPSTLQPPRRSASTSRLPPPPPPERAKPEESDAAPPPAPSRKAAQVVFPTHSHANVRYVPW